MFTSKMFSGGLYNLLDPDASVPYSLWLRRYSVQHLTMSKCGSFFHQYYHHVLLTVTCPVRLYRHCRRLTLRTLEVHRRLSHAIERKSYLPPEYTETTKHLPVCSTPNLSLHVNGTYHTQELHNYFLNAWIVSKTVYNSYFATCSDSLSCWS